MSRPIRKWHLHGCAKWEFYTPFCWLSTTHFWRRSCISCWISSGILMCCEGSHHLKCVSNIDPNHSARVCVSVRTVMSHVWTNGTQPLCFLLLLYFQFYWCAFLFLLSHILLLLCVCDDRSAVTGGNGVEKMWYAHVNQVTCIALYSVYLILFCTIIFLYTFVDLMHATATHIHDTHSHTNTTNMCKNKIQFIFLLCSEFNLNLNSIY